MNSVTASADDENTDLRVGFSARLFVDVNENDARAALKVWSRAMGDERGIPVDPNVSIYKSIDEIRAALLTEQVDCVSMTTVELWQIHQTVPVWPTIVLGTSDEGVSSEFVLLVHNDSPVRQFSDLQGESLLIHGNGNDEFAKRWLETELLDAKLGRLEDFWSKTTTAPKLSRAILPVFFKQEKACLVTRAAFRTMAELNPQVGRQLRVIATSPSVVTVTFSFRANPDSPHRERLIAQVGRITETTMGRQTLALFQTEELVARPFTELEPSFALLDRHQRLLHELTAATAAATSPATPAQGLLAPK
ncbi:MAG: PhnD/SsuA/transferrin family substrate-binding protein [Candidatus Didemnitutus sp.]|nr:PhnD/SsuA/transferrin family substrate-binding protein [Candidatus Didemnitutus sp.]